MLHHLLAGELTSVLPLGARLGEARSSALFKAVNLEVIRIVLLRGMTLPDHEVDGEITVQCIEGSVEFSTFTKISLMCAGDFLHLLRGQTHALRAIEDSSLLITISLPRIGDPGS